MKILVAMSGGVDSSTVASILKNEGHEVEGAMMTICKSPKSVSLGTHPCCYGADKKGEIEAAERVCDKLNIPFHLLDFSDIFDDYVLKTFKNEYLEARTPNPCVLCNEKVKFGALLDYSLDKFDKFATGHYVRIAESNGKFHLKKGVEEKKDQSYFLYRLTQKQLSRIITPLGDFAKNETREMAKKFGLDVSNKPDSQDFYNGNYNELLNIEPKIGNIVNLDGKILGQHQGVWNYTIGQRKGLQISATKPLYVVRLDAIKNEVVVGFEENCYNNSLCAKKINWIETPSNKEFEAMVKVRSMQKEIPALVTIFSCDKINVSFKFPQKSLTLGQSVVLYNEDRVLGGGIISEVF